jgi:Gpi18-like mannosyltransferase
MKNKYFNAELLAISLISIAGTFVYAYVSYVLNTDSWPDSVISIWNTWDTQHYIKIAADGYSSTTSDDRHLLIAFFPFFPLLSKAFSYVLRDYLLSGLIVSNLLYIAAVFYLYKLVLLDYGRDDALRSVIYLSIFPTAYFLHAAYTESLFIALTVASFYYARNDRWAISGILGMLSTLTRITGIIILPVLLIEYLYQKQFKKESIRKDVIWVFVIGLGLLIYLAINYHTYGDAFKFLEVQREHWKMHLALPTKGLIYSFNSTTWSSPQYAMHAGWLQLVFVLTSLALIIYSFFRIRLSYSLYALANWQVITSTSFLASTPRFFLTFFPIFIVLGLLGRRKEIDYAIIFLSLTFYALFLTQFIGFRWAF